MMSLRRQGQEEFLAAWLDRCHDENVTLIFLSADKRLSSYLTHFIRLHEIGEKNA
jgi:hypothetical protein